MSWGRRRLLEVALITLLLALVPVAKDVREYLEGRAAEAQHDDRHVYGPKRQVLKQLCKWQDYEYLKPELRQFYNEHSDGQRWVPEHIATDFNYDFFYDFENDEIFCSRRETPGAPAVFSGPPQRNSDFVATVIKWCLVVLGVCIPLYILLLLFR
jgi:hypothetical protein